VKTAAERKQAERERRREQGLVRVDAWVHPDDAPAIRRYIERTRKKRSAHLNKGVE
jgi:hypothetical protein